MKFDCPCSALIPDSTDNLPHKAHLIPDQEWFALHDAIDDQILAPLAAGRLDFETAAMRLRMLVGVARIMYQCHACGRVFINDRRHQLHGYAPTDETTEKEIFRTRGM